MPFLQLHLTLGDLDPDLAEETCFAAGAVSVTLTDAADDPILEPAPGATPLWPTIALSALFDADADPDTLTAHLRFALDRTDLAVTCTLLADRAWEREWLKDFKPMRFGNRLWICPGGQPPPEQDPNHVIIWLDPGLAFGTGTHATTALCLEWLDAAEVGGMRVLDVGTGSGILSIAARRLGASFAHALDIDPQALIATQDNAARNQVDTGLEIALADQPWGGNYDLVLANILAEPLVELAPRIASCTRAGGRLVLSGLLAPQAERVANAYHPWFEIAPARERDGWVALSGIRRS